MYNCLQTIKAHFSPKLLVVLTIFMMICGGAWATNYTWTGTVGDGLWSSPGNWDDGSGTPVATAPNNASDSVTISASTAVTIDIDVDIDAITLGTGSTLTINSGTIVSVDTISGEDDSVTNNGHLITPNTPTTWLDTTNSGGITTVATAGSVVWTGASGSNNFWSNNANWFGGTPSSSVNIIIPAVSNQPVITNLEESPATIDASKLTVDAANGANISVNGYLTFTGDFALSSAINSSSSGTIIVNGKLTNSSVSLPSISIECDTAAVSGGLECNSLTCNGSAVIDGDNTFTNLICKGNTELNDNNSITNFSASGLDGLELKIAGTQTISGNVSLSGAGSGANALTISGNGSLILTNPLFANYLKFSAASPSGTTDKTYASNSTGNATNWIVSEGNIHIWNGSTTEWEEASNWLPAGAAATPSGDDDEVIISTNTASKYPEISSEVTLKSIIINAGTVTINDGKSLTLVKGTELDTKIEGAGTLILDGASQVYTITGAKEFNINIENKRTLNGGAGAITLKKSFTNNGTASFNGGVTINGNFTNSNSTTFSGNVEVTGDVTDTGTTFTGKITFNRTDGTEQTFTTAGTSYTEIEVANNAVVTLDGDLTTTGDQTYTGTLKIGGTSTLSSTSGQIKFDNNVFGTGTLTVSSAATLADSITIYPAVIVSATTGSLTCDGAATFSRTVTNNGTINVSDSLSAISFSGSGTINLTNGTTSLKTTDDSTTTYTVILENTDATIQGNFQFGSFTANTNMSGKTITLNGATIKAGTISLSGTDTPTVSRLELAGTGTFDTSSLSADYLKIGSDLSLVSFTGTLVDNHCIPTAGESDANYLAVMHKGWPIKALSAFVFTWDGSESTIWKTPDNWDIGFTPENNCQIIIPDLGESANYPVIPDDDVYEGGTLSIAAGASIQLGTQNLKLSGIDKDHAVASATRLSNAGTIIYTNAGRITNGTNVINDVANAGTVTYKTDYAGIIEHFSDGSTDDYYNLVIYGKNWKLSGDLKLNTITLGDANTVCNITDDALLQAADFVFNGKFSIAIGKNVTLAPYNDNADFTIPSVMDNKFDFKADNAGENKGWVFLGKDGYSKNIIFDNVYLLSYKIKLNSKTTLNKNLTVRNSVTATDEINGDGILIIDGSGTQKITLESGKNYKKIQIQKDMTNAKSKVTFFNSNYTIENLSITKGKETVFDGSPEITSFSANANAGNIVFSNGGSITNTNNETINTTGNVTIDSTTTAMTITGTFNQTAGTTTVKGNNISAANFYAANIIAGATAKITTASGEQTYTTINGTNETEELTLTGAAIKLNGNVGENKKLAKLIIDGTTSIGADCSITADEFDFTDNISGSGKELTINVTTLESTKTSTPAAEITAAELIVADDVTLESSNGITINTTKISGTGKKLTNSNSLTLAAGITVDPIVENNGAITCDGDVNFNGKYSGTGNLTVADADTTFSHDVDLSSCGVFTTGKVILTAASKSGAAADFTGPQIFNNLTISGPVNLSDDNTINGTLLLTGTDTLSILGNNTIAALTANGLGGKTITFGAGTEQEITGTLSLTGNNQSSLLTLSLPPSSTGSWNIKSTNEPELNYLLVKNSTNSTPGTPAPGTNFVAFNSTDGGSNIHWNFPDMFYKWEGNTDTIWNKITNWENSVVPTKGAKIEIQKVAEGKFYPKLTFDIDLNTSLTSTTPSGPVTTNYKGEITVKPGATFDLDDQKVTAGKITNNGLIRLNGNAADQITGGCETSNGSETGADPTIEYTGTGTGVNTYFVWDSDNNNANGKQYVNLILNRTNANVTEKLIVSKNLSIKAAATVSEDISVSGLLTINAATSIANDKSISASGDVTSTADVSAAVANGNGKLIFTGADSQDQTFKAGGKSYANLEKQGSKALTITEAFNTISTFTNPSSTGAITFNSGGTITNSADFQTTGKVTFGNENTDSITFSNSISHTTGPTQITGNVNAGSFTCYNLKISGAVTIETSGIQNYEGTINGTTANTDTLSLNSKGNLITFNGNIGTSEPLLKSLTTVAVTSPATLSPVKINCSSIKTSATQTYNGAIDLGSCSSLTLQGTTVTFNSDVSDSETETSLEVNGKTTINCDNVETQGNQTYDNEIILNKSTILTAQTATPAYNTVTFKGNVTGSTAGTTLTINANTEIADITADTTTITTNSTQTYNGTITFDNPANITSSTDSLIFNGLITLDQKTTLSAASTGKEIDFKGNISGTGKTLTINTPSFISTIPATGIEATETATITLGTLTIAQNTTIDSTNGTYLTLNTSTINKSNTSATLTFGNSVLTIFKLINGISIIPDLTNNKTIICNGAATFSGTVTNNGTLTGYTTDATKDLIFERAYSGTGTLTASAGNTNFKANVDLSSTTFNHSNGTVNFNGNGTGTAQPLTTKGDGSTDFYNIQISTPAKVTTTSSFTVSGTSWSNTTATDGFTATAATITFNNGTATAAAPVTVSGKNKFYDVVCQTADQNISFTSDNIFSHYVTIGDSSNIPNNVIISSASAITFAPEVYCNNLILNSGANAIIFTADSFFNTSFKNETSGLLTFEGDATYGNSFINQSAAITDFKKSFTGTNGDATFTGDITLTDDADRSFSTSAGHNITTAGDFIVNTDAANTIQLNTSQTSLVKAQNFVLYSGAMTLDGTLEAAKDIILLGPDYTTSDPQTGIDGIYLYNQTRPSAVNYTTAFIAAPYNGELNALEDATIKAGKNFYSNGITLTGPAAGTWNIQLLKVSDSHKGFAEAIKTTVSNCAVSCWEDSSNTATDDTAPAKIVAYECTDNSGNTNWNFDDFEIINAWTERDDAIFVEFNAPVRNLYNEITNSLTHLTYQGTNAASTAFTGIYSAPDCQDADHIADADIELTNGAYSLYLKAPDSWNTDATGKSAGTTALSSDRGGNHKTSVPYIDIPRSLSGVNYIITNKWGKRLNNYSTRTPTAGFSYGTNETAGSETYVLDKTGPVLWSIRTGQELHDAYNTATGEASQHSYDSHNFLEFRYSEPVSFGSDDASICDIEILAYSTGTTVNLEENVQVTDRFGAISGNQGFTSAADEITFTGLARLTAPAANQLIMYTGSQGAPNKYMNALYRTDEYSLRLSVAGWTDGTISDYSGNAYKKWAGYIEEASQFTGATAHTVAATNNLVKDQQGNIQIQYAANMTEPVIRSDSGTDNPSSLVPVTSPAAPADLYSLWDLSSPVFTPLRFSRESEWGDQTMSEAIGNTNGSGSTLDRIDFHFFDNTPDYATTDPAEWFTEIGWCLPGTEASKDNLKDVTYTYCADIIGGARQFDTVAARRTTGGIRFSTKAGIAPAFKYSTSPNNPSPASAFVTGISGVHTTVVSQLFTGSSSPMRPANDPDGLYLGLGLTDTSLSVETTFAFSYNENQGYLTDLAGNRLRTKLSKTIDRTPPSFDVIISPVDTKSVYIIFVKELVTDSSKIKFRDNTGVPININDKYSFLTLMPECFRLISIDGSGNAVPDSENQIDTSIPAEIIDDFSNESFTCIKLTTTKEIEIENLKNLYVQLVLPEYYQNLYPNGTTDPLTSNTNSRVTFIQDNLGNYMSMYSAHALSDFAINYVNPLYAYSSDMLYENDSVMNGLYEAGSWAVHYWNADQNNYGTLPAEHPVSIVADTKANEKIRVYLSPAPDADSISKQFNSDFDLKLRVWLPDLQDGIFRALSANNNTNFVYSDGEALEENPDNSIFNISKETVSAWPNGAQVSFMFGLMEDANNPVRIYSNPYYDIEADRFNLSLSIPVPLYCLRMPDSADISTLDLWSFKIKGITSQRGGVTILNNVINASRDEKTVIVVDMPEDGNLTVCVMTLDGNIITYLNRGSTKAGEYYYTWNGKNKNGKSVARGMYFVRVLGGGIDETRKVMVVKD